MFFENLDPSVESKGDMKEGYYIGPSKDVKSECNLNQWPSKELLPFWKETIECYHEKMLALGTKLLSIVALALNLDENFFEKISALKDSNAFIRLLHYPGNLSTIVDGGYGASAHSDYGMITLLVTDGVPGLQICREKDVLPRQWEDVHHIHGAFIVNIGDMLERWTNCLFRSTLHRVLSVGQERYSVAFFLDPSDDCIVECLESCCSEACPPRFPPIRSGDYLFQRMADAYSLK